MSEPPYKCVRTIKDYFSRHQSLSESLSSDDESTEANSDLVTVSGNNITAGNATSSVNCNPTIILTGGGASQ